MLTNSVCFIPAVLSESFAWSPETPTAFFRLIFSHFLFQRRFFGTFNWTKTQTNYYRCRYIGNFDSVDVIRYLATGQSRLSIVVDSYFGVFDFVALVGELHHWQQFISWVHSPLFFFYRYLNWVFVPLTVTQSKAWCVGSARYARICPSPATTSISMWHRRKCCYSLYWQLPSPTWMSSISLKMRSIGGMTHSPLPFMT